MKVHVAAAVRRGSEDLSEGIRRIRRGFPEEEPSATAVCIDEGRGKSVAPVFSQAPFVSCQLINGLQPQIHFPTTGMRRTRIAATMKQAATRIQSRNAIRSFFIVAAPRKSPRRGREVRLAK